MLTRHVALFAAVPMLLCMATPSQAIRLLKAGPQTLEGVLVRTGNPSGCLIPPGRGIAPRAPKYALVLSAGSRSEQTIRVDFPVGNREVPEYLKGHAVPQQPRSMYEGVARVSLFGNLEGSMGQGFVFHVANVPGGGPDFSEAGMAQRILQRWRFMAADADHTGQASAAMARLERAGLLEKMIETVFEVSREE